MKHIIKGLLIFSFSVALFSCTDDELVQNIPSNNENFNIKEFADGYSVAFEMTIDRFGDASNTRTADDLEIEEWESYLHPEEFRILFFDSQDRFLFESNTRWFAQVASQSGGRRWKVGVPIFQYLSDGFNENLSSNPNLSIDEEYNWARILEIMRSESFKIAILGNRPDDIGLHDLSDFNPDDVDVETFGRNGPFWGPINSRATYEFPDDEESKKNIKNVFDLHHSQYDPYYENKNGEGAAYSFIMEFSPEKTTKGTTRTVPHMGAMSDWVHSKRTKMYPKDNPTSKRNYFKLPKGQILEYDKDGKLLETPSGTWSPDKDQYIPMYGIQQFAPLTTWTKGTTYNLSEQTGTQTGEYDYKSISLLRSVVKLELRIPMYDKDGNKVEVNNDYAQICAANLMARNEPMDIWTPTEQIWQQDHLNDCEWIAIINNGLYADAKTTDYEYQLSWFYGAWHKENKWDFGKVNVKPEVSGYNDYPRVFNPMNQRAQRTMITDCYLPIEIPGSPQQSYHRWIVYCGEKNMNDPNTLNDLTTTGYITSFRVEVRRLNKNTGNQIDKFIYNLPITDYSNPDNPIWNFYKETGDIEDLNSYPSFLEKGSPGRMLPKFSDYKDGYYNGIRDKATPDCYPYPLIRNHHYRLTLSYGDSAEDINVEVIDGEKRFVDDIFFN